MTSQKKRYTKKLFKLFKILTYIFFSIVMIMFIIFSIKIIILKTSIPFSFPLITSIFIGLVIATFIFAWYATMYEGRLRNYKNNIVKYRQYKFFMLILKLIEDKEFSTAINYYSTSIHRKNIDHFLYAHIITGRLYSEDETERNKGIETMNRIKETFNQNKINFK